MVSVNTCQYGLIWLRTISMGEPPPHHAACRHTRVAVVCTYLYGNPFVPKIWPYALSCRRPFPKKQPQIIPFLVKVVMCCRTTAVWVLLHHRTWLCITVKYQGLPTVLSSDFKLVQLTGKSVSGRNSAPLLPINSW